MSLTGSSSLMTGPPWRLTTGLARFASRAPIRDGSQPVADVRRATFGS